jgi:F-type H+-transporting ATPase subunit epsilon
LASFPFELVTPERLLFSGEVDGVVIPGTEGDFEVLAHHAPLMTSIRPGLIGVREAPGREMRRLFVRGGFAEVNPTGLTILAERAIPFEELSADAIALEVRMAEEDVTDAPSDAARAKAEQKLGQLRDLQRAVAR